MDTRKTLLTISLAICAFLSQAQVEGLKLKQTINKGPKLGVLSVAVSAQGDKIAVGYTDGAALFDAKSGKKIHIFKHEVDGSKNVNWIGFSPNGEFVCTVGVTGKRKIWLVKSGKEDKYLPPHKDWMPTPKHVKEELGLKMTNSKFDIKYTQKNAWLKGTRVYGYALKAGVIKFMDGDTERELKEIKLTCEKNVLHYAPVYFFPDKKWFVTGNDVGEVYIYQW